MFKPLHDQLLVEEVSNSAAGVGTIVLLHRTHHAQQGRVVAVSDGYYQNEETITQTPMPVTANTVILFPKGSGYGITIDKKSYIMLKREHILGIVSE